MSPKSISLPDSMSFVQDIDSLIQPMFPDIRNRYEEGTSDSRRAVSTTRNIRPEMMNEPKAELVPVESPTYVNADINDNFETYVLKHPLELLNSVPGPAYLPDHVMSSKDSYMMILLRSFQLKKVDVNEARYIVKFMTKNVLFLRIAKG